MKVRKIRIKMKRFRRVLWGLLFISLGAVIGLNSLGVINVDLFFEGWWTLFIIVPSFISLFSKGDKTGSFIGLFIGIALLLIYRDIIDYDTVMKLILPAILIIIGISFIFRRSSEKTTSEKIEFLKNKYKHTETAKNEHCAVFSGQDLNFSDEIFEGASLSAVFGGIKCDLRGAIIENDVLINAETVFGGIDIYPPANVKVKIRSTSIFGGTSNKAVFTGDDNSPTVYVNATCIFGGVDVK